MSFFYPFYSLNVWNTDAKRQLSYLMPRSSLEPKLPGYFLPLFTLGYFLRGKTKQANCELQWHACMHAQSCLTVTPWPVTHQAPLSLEFSRQEYWNGVPFSPPGDLPNPGTEPESPVLAGGFFTQWHTTYLLKFTKQAKESSFKIVRDGASSDQEEWFQIYHVLLGIL